MPSTLWLPDSLQARIGNHLTQLLNRPQELKEDFSRPAGEAALISPDSVSWRVFKNPVALFIGGITAVILELAEPSIRAGVWRHSTFKKNPMQRLQRTGLAAMLTVYGPRSSAERMIAKVVRMHARIEGNTASGLRYSASDPLLLAWVHTTAAYAFSEAYRRFASALSREELDAFYAEGAPAARLYGVLQPPRREQDVRALFDMMRHRLQPSPILFEFLQIMRDAPTLPKVLRPVQLLLIRAGVDLLPLQVRTQLGLTSVHRLGRLQTAAVRALVVAADRVVLTDGPAAQACVRLGLPPSYLYERSHGHPVRSETELTDL